MRRDAVVEEVQPPSGEPAVTVSGTPDTKEAVPGGEVTGGEKQPGGASSGSGRKPQVKKMPKRPAAKLMPRRKTTKVKTEPGATTKVPGKNRFKNQETKRRQKAKWEEIKKTAKEERAQPAPASEIPARGGDVPVRSFFDPISGRRETMEVKPIEREQKFRTVQSGFSRYPTETRTCYQCGEKGHLSANCPQKMRRVSLTEGVIKYEGAGETRPRVRLQGNMGSIPQEASEFDDVRPEDSASQVGGQYLGTMSSVGTTKKSLPPPPPPPMSGSPKIARSRPGVPPQTSATSASMQPPPRLPAKFSQDPPLGEAASSSNRPDVRRPKAPPKRPPVKTPPVKGSVGKMTWTPSPKRAAEKMAEGVKAPATVAKAPATVDVATPHTAVDLVTPASDNVGQGDAHLVAAQGSGRDASKFTSSNAYVSSRRFLGGRRSTRTKFSPLVERPGDITDAGDTPASTGGRRDRGLCGMPREWIAELAGESAIVPTYRNGAAPFGGADCPSCTSGPRLRPHLRPGSGRTCNPSSGSCKSHGAW